MTAGSSQSRRDHIFISYRRDDARGASGRIYDWLRIAFGRDCVFRDVHSIGVGKWRDKIDAALARSAVCVAVVGPRWANADNLPRLQDHADMVRYELLTALGSDAITVVPTLVEGVQVDELPLARLPADLQPLFSVWNARAVTEVGWEDDIRRLIAEIADAGRLAVGPDLDTLLRQAVDAQQRVIELEATRHLQSDHIAALRQTIEDLRQKLAEAPARDRPGLAAAFAALAQGDSQVAENAFEREYEAQSHAADQARQDMAEAARNVANLALLRDIAKAVSFYRKALAADPDDAESARLLGHALLLLGDVRGAEAALSQSLDLATAQRDAAGEIAAQIGLGIVFQTNGNLATAEQALAKALRLAKRRRSGNSGNGIGQRGLAVILDRIGDVRIAKGDGAGALAAYREALAIAEALAARDPGNSEGQRDLSVSHTKIGDMQVAQGDLAGALVTFRKGLAINEALAARDPESRQWQRDVAVSHDRIGAVLVAQGDEASGLAACRNALSICEALASGDPANTEWQRDVALSHSKIGDMLFSRIDGSKALAAYRKGLAILEALTVLDPANADWQGDLAGMLDRIGDVLLLAQDDARGALAAYNRARSIREALTIRDPANAERQRGLSGSEDRIGDVLLRFGDEEGALAAYRKGLSIREALTARNPANTDWQRDLSVSHNKIGDALRSLADWEGALGAYGKGLAIREALTSRDPSNVQWRRDVVVSYVKLSTVRDGQSVGARRDHLLRGREILLGLAPASRTAADHERIDWFDEQIAELPSVPK